MKAIRRIALHRPPPFQELWCLTWLTHLLKPPTTPYIDTLHAVPLKLLTTALEMNANFVSCKQSYQFLSLLKRTWKSINIKFYLQNRSKTYSKRSQWPPLHFFTSTLKHNFSCNPMWFTRIMGRRICSCFKNVSCVLLKLESKNITIKRNTLQTWITEHVWKGSRDVRDKKGYQIKRCQR